MQTRLPSNVLQVVLCSLSFLILGRFVGGRASDPGADLPEIKLLEIG